MTEMEHRVMEAIDANTQRCDQVVAPKASVIDSMSWADLVRLFTDAPHGGRPLGLE